MLAAATGMALAAGAAPISGQTREVGARAPRALYVAACVSCHGADGQGNPRIDAPVLAGLRAAYLERQLDDFRRGYRGLRDARWSTG